MKDLLSKGKLVAILRNEGKWEVIFCLNDTFKIIKIVYEKSIYQLLKQLSNYYHRPYKEEIKLISKEFNIFQKVPMLFNINDLMLFPTHSLGSEKCVLINYYCVHKFVKDGNNTIVFLCFPYNDNKILIDEKIKLTCDRRTISKQFIRCEQINCTLKERIIR